MFPRQLSYLGNQFSPSSGSPPGLPAQSLRVFCSGLHSPEQQLPCWLSVGEVSSLAAGLGKVCTQDVRLMVLTWLSGQERRAFKGCLLLQSTRSLFSGRCSDVAVDGHEQPVPNCRSPVLGWPKGEVLWKGWQPQQDSFGRVPWTKVEGREPRPPTS